MNKELQKELRRLLEVTVHNTIMEGRVDQECFQRYGKELFGSVFGQEPDTDIESYEKKLLQLFTDYEFGKGLNNDFMIALDNLSKCLKTYPEVLLPDTTSLYRGTKISWGEFSKVVLASKPTFKKEIKAKNISGSFYSIGKFTYKPKSPVQSWSAAMTSAYGFGFTDTTNVQVVLYGKMSPGDLLFNSKAMNKLSNYNNEHEVLRISSKPVKVSVYVHTNQIRASMGWYNKEVNPKALEWLKLKAAALD